MKHRIWIMVAVLILFIVGIAYIFMAMELSLYEKQLLAIVFVIAILSSVFSSALGRVSRHVPDREDMWFNRDATNWLADWLAGISTEMIGALITTVLLGIILSQLEVKDTLIEQIHSHLEPNAVQALEDMRVYGWLTNGTLQGESLIGVTWVDADLRQADLRDANLADAVLQGSDLSHSFFQRANLEGANLSDADLSYVSMQEANLSQTDLSGITALDANL
ncbi:pentapeptide repeat-containing protein, partial [Candidatus Kaiserbacteria bacterium]|nr:pentapeptide repeat-containing protein [Candidatus Kaiserbacteria bacterium]